MKKDEPINLTLPFAPHEFPSVRIGAALANKADKELCFVVGGGIGDRVCAEPTLRFALETFKDVSISLICETPEIFQHLSFKEVFDLKTKYPVVGRHLYLNTYPKSALANQFINANMVDLVDFASISALRGQLPFYYKKIQLWPKPPDRNKSYELYDIASNDRFILIHPGKSWPSRTFPAEFWEDLLWKIHKMKKVPVIIGNNTVDIQDRFHVAVDLRNKTNLNDFIWLCKNSKAIVTNDSSPLHLAAAGSAKIAFIATCRRWDLLLHHRGPLGEKGWNMRDFGKFPVWANYPMVPNFLDEQKINELPPGNTFADILPDPIEIIEWLIK